MGQGFAVLDIQPRHNQQLHALDQHIPWSGDQEELIYANFDQMPLHCSRCHEPGHAVADCPRARRNQKGCFKCGAQSHYAASCPTVRNSEDWTPGGNKTSRRKTGHTRDQTPSKELLKSKHASVKGKPVEPTNRFAPLENLDTNDDKLATDAETTQEEVVDCSPAFMRRG